LTGVNAAANRRRNINGEDSAPHSVGSHEVMAAHEMKSVYASAAIGLTIGVGPAIIARLMPQIGMLDQLGAVILGLIIGMQAASRRRTRYDRRGPEEAMEHAERLASRPRNSAASRLSTTARRIRPHLS
jgi:hypothetical protein